MGRVSAGSVGGIQVLPATGGSRARPPARAVQIGMLPAFGPGHPKPLRRGGPEHPTDDGLPAHVGVTGVLTCRWGRPGAKRPLTVVRRPRGADRDARVKSAGRSSRGSRSSTGRPDDEGGEGTVKPAPTRTVHPGLRRPRERTVSRKRLTYGADLAPEEAGETGPDGRPPAAAVRGRADDRPAALRPRAGGPPPPVISPARGPRGPGLHPHRTTEVA